jgi:hypothetical protein
MRPLPTAASAALVAVTVVYASPMQSRLESWYHDRMAKSDTPPGTAWGRDSCASHRSPGAADVAVKLTARERTLRKLPLPYSLALRLRNAGAPPDVVCEYLAVPADRLDGFYRMAEAKFAAAQHTTTQLRVARPSTAECVATPPLGQIDRGASD